MNPYKFSVKPEFDFNNPEDFKKLEQMAYDMTIDIEKFPPAAYRYFDKLRTLYARFKYDNLSKEEAEKLKAKLLADYKETLKAYDNWRGVYKYYQDNIRKAGELLSKIEKADDTKEIAMLSCLAIGLMTGDENFAKRQTVKINGGIYG